jgi:hypothetical protein
MHINRIQNKNSVEKLKLKTHDSVLLREILKHTKTSIEEHFKNEAMMENTLLSTYDI